MKPSGAQHAACPRPDAEKRPVNSEMLDKAVFLAKKVGHVFIATADAHGVPHIAAASGLEKSGPESVSVSEWFCPGTVRNLRQNEHISLAIWEKDADFGYQLIGHLAEYKNVSVLDGFTPAIEGRSPLPQLEKQLFIRVETIFDFSVAPHSDAEEG